MDIERHGGQPPGRGGAHARAAGEASAAAEHHTGHPGPKFYVLIGVILTVVTAVEIAVYYIEVLDAWSTAIIVPLSAAKFLLVVLFYMHLKFDNTLLSAVFAACGVLAIALIVSLIILFRVLPYSPLS